MELVYLGKIVNTHGIKGEVRIISDFEYKEEAFKVGNKVKVENDDLIISTYRKHKNYDMITFEGITYINDVLKYKGSNIYIDKASINYDGYLNQELIGLDVYDLDKRVGKVVDIYKSKLYDILVIEGVKRHLVPLIDEFILNIDIPKHKIKVKYIKGLNNED